MPSVRGRELKLVVFAILVVVILMPSVRGRELKRLNNNGVNLRNRDALCARARIETFTLTFNPEIVDDALCARARIETCSSCSVADGVTWMPSVRGRELKLQPGYHCQLAGTDALCARARIETPNPKRRP